MLEGTYFVKKIKNWWIRLKMPLDNKKLKE